MAWQNQVTSNPPENNSENFQSVEGININRRIPTPSAYFSETYELLKNPVVREGMMGLISPNLALAGAIDEWRPYFDKQVALYRQVLKVIRDNFVLEEYLHELESQFQSLKEQEGETDKALAIELAAKKNEGTSTASVSKETKSKTKLEVEPLQEDEQEIPIPKDFFCSITQQVMEEPLIDPCGHSFEEKAIRRWIEVEKQKVICPLINAIVIPYYLMANIDLKRAIGEFEERYKEYKKQEAILHQHLWWEARNKIVLDRRISDFEARLTRQGVQVKGLPAGPVAEKKVLAIKSKEAKVQAAVSAEFDFKAAGKKNIYVHLLRAAESGNIEAFERAKQAGTLLDILKEGGEVHLFNAAIAARESLIFEWLLDAIFAIEPSYAERLDVNLAQKIAIDCVWPLPQKEKVLKRLKFWGIAVAPLHLAATLNDRETLDDALAEKITDTSDADGNTRLHYVVANGHFETAKGLLETGGSKITEKNKKGNNVLMLAARTAQLKIIKYCVEKLKMNINEEDAEGMTALHHAIVCRHIKIVRYLAIKGADVAKKNKEGVTPLMLAAMVGDKEIVIYLVQVREVKIEEKDDKGWTALTHAINSNQSQIMEYLIEYCNANVTHRDKTETSILLFAAINGYWGVVKHLLKSNKEAIADKNQLGYTVLLVAAKVSELSIVKYLIKDCKANTKDKTKDVGATALHFAAARGHLEMVKFLVLEAGMSINEKDNQNKTPLDVAKAKGHAEIIQFLENCLAQHPSVSTARPALFNSSSRVSKKEEGVEYGPKPQSP